MPSAVFFGKRWSLCAAPMPIRRGLIPAEWQVNGGRRRVTPPAGSAMRQTLMTGSSEPADDAGARRLEALDRYAILDTAAEPGFDDIVELAVQICEAPVSLVTLIDEDRQWFKARIGFAPRQTSFSQSICVHALAADDLLVIPDLTQDPRTRDNTLVTGPDHLRFYAGAVLKTPQGVPFGSLCVIDIVPRPGGLSQPQQSALKILAGQVVTQLELRRALSERDRALVERQRAETLMRQDIDRHETMVALHAKIGHAAGGLPAILDAVVEAALRVVPSAQGSAIELSRAEGLAIEAAAGTLASRIGERLPMQGSLSGASLRDGRTLLSGRVDRDPRIDPDLTGGRGPKALLAAPVARLGEFIGVLELQSDLEDAFTLRDVQSAELLAAAIAAGFGDVAETRSVRELRASEQLLRQAQEAGQVGTFSTDVARSVTAGSVQFFRLFGLEPMGEVPTSVLEALVIEADRDRTTSEARRKAGLDATRVEYRIRRADTGDVRWLARGADYLRDAEGHVVSLIGTTQDITDRKVAELELAAARDAAEAANRAKSNFLANMSHELRTPLSAVIGYSEMMEEEVADLGGPELLKDLGKIKSNARHLLGLINDVLDLSKIEADRMEVYAENIDVAALTAEVAGTVGSLVQRRRNHLVLEVAEDVGHMRSDAVKLRQCLLNLLSNACKFTESGRITLAVTREEQPAGHGTVNFSITDTGIGMTEEQVGRLFERFSQADETTTRRFGGTGLGLALTRAFCELLGGTIAVGSRLGTGTCFTLQLPAVLPERSAVEEA